MSETDLSASENEQLLLQQQEERIQRAEQKNQVKKQLEDLGRTEFERALAERKREHLVQAEIDIIYHRLQKLSHDMRIAVQEGRSAKGCQDLLVDPTLLLLRSNLDAIQMLAGIEE